MSQEEIGRIHAELKELGVKIDNLTELFNRAAYDVGFTRCAAQAKRLDHAEKSIDLCHARISAVKKWLVAGLVSVISLLVHFVWNVFQDSWKNH